MGIGWRTPDISLFFPGLLVSPCRQEYREQCWERVKGGSQESPPDADSANFNFFFFSAINLSIPQNKSFNFICELGFCSCRFMQCSEAGPRAVNINQVTESVRM